MRSVLQRYAAVAGIVGGAVGCAGDTPIAPQGPPEKPLFTVGSGLTTTPAVRGNLGTVKFDKHFGDFDFELKSRHDSDVVTVTVTGGAGSHSGWHSHPGPAIVIVRQGTLTSYVVEDGECRRTVYPAGSAFIEGELPHIVVNEGTTTMELSVVFFTPTTVAQRIDQPNPGVC